MCVIKQVYREICAFLLPSSCGQIRKMFEQDFWANVKFKLNALLCPKTDEGVDNEPGEARQTAGAGPHWRQGEL